MSAVYLVFWACSSWSCYSAGVSEARTAERSRCIAHSPGCYGLQLDSAAGTHTIITRLTRTHR